jgi:AraC family transcriptional activator of pobA
MKESLLHYSGLYGDQLLSPQSDFVNCEPLEVRTKAYDWEISQHFHTDLIQMFFIKEGRGQLIIDKNNIDIDSKSIIIIPANTIHGFQFYKYAEGEVLTISQNLLESVFKSNPNILNQVLSSQKVTLKNNKEAFQNALSLYKMISDELLNDKTEKYFAIKSFLGLLFLQIHRNSFEEKRQELFANNKTLAYYQKFLILIKQNIDHEKKVSDHAKEMQMTVVHLNRICRQVSNKSALQVMQEILILEAKNYLLNTAYSISEIAYFLNFNDPAYFNRLFKKHVGVPPGEFRKS